MGGEVNVKSSQSSAATLFSPMLASEQKVSVEVFPYVLCIISQECGCICGKNMTCEMTAYAICAPACTLRGDLGICWAGQL